jgi:hypothetical protein
MDTTGNEKRSTDPRSTLFDRLNLQKSKGENGRTSPLAAGHRGHRRRGGDKPEGLSKMRVKEEGRDRGIATF